MRRIIKGKVYDTETATLIAGYSNGLGYSDFRNFSEYLYLTNNGQWFVAGEGGALTPYAEHCGNSISGSSEIALLSKDAAFEWVVIYQSSIKNAIEIIKKYFNDMVAEG